MTTVVNSWTCGAEMLKRAGKLTFVVEELFIEHGNADGDVLTAARSPGQGLSPDVLFWTNWSRTAHGT